jgi:hypothetical protein
VVLADTTGNGLATFQVASNGTMVEQNQVASQRAAFTNQISALSVVTQGSNSFVLAASASNHSITAYAVSSNGTLSPAPTSGPAQATLISAAAEFRIANYDAADINQFVFFQS